MINPAEIPQIPGDMGMLGTHATAISGVGTGFPDTGGRVHSTWQGLSGVYAAPESGQLFAASGPVRTVSASVGQDLVTVGGALSTYATEVAAIKARLEALRTQATDFVNTVGAEEDWRENEDDVNRHNQLLSDVNAAVAEFMDAQRRCANSILGLYSDLRYVAENGDGTIAANEFGYSRDLLDAALAADGGLPWGSAEEHDRGFWGDVGAFFGGIGTGAVDTVKGLGALIGYAEGEWSWATAGAAWGSLGTLALAVTTPYLIGINEVTDLPFLPKGTLLDTLEAAGKGIIAYDTWGEDKSKAAGMATFNIVTAIVGTKGAGAGLRAGGGAAAASQFATVARVGAGAVRVGEFIGRLPSVSDVVLNTVRRFPSIPIPRIDIPGVDIPPTHVDPPRIDPPSGGLPERPSVGDGLGDQRPLPPGATITQDGIVTGPGYDAPPPAPRPEPLPPGATITQDGIVTGPGYDAPPPAPRPEPLPPGATITQDGIVTGPGYDTAPTPPVREPLPPGATITQDGIVPGRDVNPPATPNAPEGPPIRDGVIGGRPEVDLPGSRPDADLPPARPDADLPGGRPDADLPAGRPEADLPGARPEADLPPVRPNADVPGGRPEAEIPAGGPEADLPPGTRPDAGLPPARPDAEIPGGRPDADLPTGRPEADLPGGRPDADAPAARPDADLPEGRADGDLPDGRPEGDLPDGGTPDALDGNGPDGNTPDATDGVGPDGPDPTPPDRPDLGRQPDGSWVGEEHGARLKLEPDANTAADTLLRNAAINEPKISPRIQEIVGRVDGARMPGYPDFVLKAEDSLKRKLATDLLKDADLTAADTPNVVKDSVRYTMEIPDGSYTAGVQQAVADLRAQGYQSVTFKPAWDNPDAYKGLNTTWYDPVTKQTFELQFHTPASFDAKMVTHGYYEAMRVPGVTPEELTRLVDKQAREFRGVNVPDRTDELLRLADELEVEREARVAAEAAAAVPPGPDINPLTGAGPPAATPNVGPDAGGGPGPNGGFNGDGPDAGPTGGQPAGPTPGSGPGGGPTPGSGPGGGPVPDAAGSDPLPDQQLPDTPENADNADLPDNTDGPDSTGTVDGEAAEGAGNTDAPPPEPPPPGVDPTWEPRVSNNGQGTVWQRPGAIGNRDSVRIMGPTDRYEHGYVRFFNSGNQPIDLHGKPTGNETTHIPKNPDGTYPLPEGWQTHDD